MMGAPPCSCDTFVSVGADAVLLGKNSDRPAFDCQPLRSHPAASHPPDATIQLEYKAIPQAGRTRATLGSSPYWCWGYEMGMNDAGVAIGNEAIFTKELRRLEGQHLAAGTGAAEPPPLGLSGMAVLRLGLERGGSAAEALEVMTALIEEHGQWGSAVPGADHPAVRTHTPPLRPAPLIWPHQPVLRAGLVRQQLPHRRPQRGLGAGDRRLRVGGAALRPRHHRRHQQRAHHPHGMGPAQRGPHLPRGRTR